MRWWHMLTNKQQRHYIYIYIYIYIRLCISIYIYIYIYALTCCCAWRWCVRAWITPAYVSIRQHTSAYVVDHALVDHVYIYIRSVSIRQHTSAYVSIRQHTSAYVSIRQHTSWITYIHTRSHLLLRMEMVREGVDLQQVKALYLIYIRIRVCM
jgi:hypothetical protein